MKKKVMIGTIITAVLGVIIGIIACSTKFFKVSDYIGGTELDDIEF